DGAAGPRDGAAAHGPDRRRDRPDGDPAADRAGAARVLLTGRPARRAIGPAPSRGLLTLPDGRSPREAAVRLLNVINSQGDRGDRGTGALDTAPPRIDHGRIVRAL